jgi:hypothetical protein
VGAAAWAAGAEGPLWFFGLLAVDATLGGSLRPTLAHLAAFTAGFVVLTAAGTALSNPRVVAPAMFLVALGLGAWEGSRLATAQPGGTIAAILVMLGVGVRAGTLALRDWREPVRLSFGVGAVALLVEVAGSGFAGAPGRPLVAAAVPVFFLGSMASRSASVRLAVGPGPYHAAGVAATLAGVGAATGIAAAFGGAGGWFQRVGSIVAPFFGFVLGALLWVVGQLARPLFWLADRVHLDLRGLQRALERIRDQFGPRAADPTTESGPFQRVLGAFLIAMVILAVLLAYRRLRARGGPRLEAARRDPVAQSVLSTERAPASAATPRRRRYARPAPADQVRRWYVEALASLERLRLVREPARTPGEFRVEVARAFPMASPPFATLTAAYERVRYGERPPDRDGLRALSSERDRLMAALKSAQPIPVPAEEDV